MLTRIILIVFLCFSVAGVFASTSSIEVRDAWRNSRGDFARAAQAGVGFSFHFNGEKVGPQLSKDWEAKIGHDMKADAQTLTLTHASGLIVIREMKVFPDFDAVEYKLRFKNATTKVLPPISRLQSLDLAFGDLVVEGNCLVSSGGGMDDAVLPPRNFALRRSCLAPSLPNKSSVNLKTEGGRSSNQDLPFFFIDNAARKAGVFVAFGWSGQWSTITAIHYPTGVLSVKGKIPNIDIALEPGEEIVGPSVLVGLYQGGLEAGSNRLRRLIAEKYTPRLAGARFLPVSAVNTYFSIGEAYNEAQMRKVVDAAAERGQEYFDLDAGWSEGGSYLGTVGNWERISRSRLPSGLKPMADYVRSKGLKLGMWFEPERVSKDSDLAREHPDWILWEHGRGLEELPFISSYPHQLEIFSDTGQELATRKFGLLDYGRPEVQSWVRSMLERYIREYGVKMLFYDSNIDPLPYWEANDKPNRRGITQLRHIQGLYSVFDGIKARYPDVMLEGVSSGGRRIDLETARRFHAFWISDHTADPAIVRFHLHGINHFLPGNYAHVIYALPGALQKNFQADDLGFQSMFAGAFGTAPKFETEAEGNLQKQRRHMAVYRTLKRYLVEDYYPLSAQPSDLESWSGWQFNDPRDRSGFFQTFRTKTPDATRRFFLKGLDRSASYRFADAYDGNTFQMSGEEAMMQGIEIKQEPMSSSVWSYQAIRQ